MTESKNLMNKAKFYMDIAEMIFSKFHKISYTDFCIELADSKDSIDNSIEFIKHIGYTFKNFRFIDPCGASEEVVNYCKEQFSEMESPDGEHEFIFVYFVRELIGFGGHFHPLYRIKDDHDLDNYYAMDVMLTTQVCDHSCMAEFYVCSNKIEKYLSDMGLAYCGTGDYCRRDTCAHTFFMNVQHEIYVKETYQETAKKYDDIERKAIAYDMASGKIKSANSKLPPS